ncbi:hypothetical protein D3C75_730380 [compost metagenome]
MDDYLWCKGDNYVFKKVEKCSIHGIGFHFILYGCAGGIGCIAESDGSNIGENA